MLYASSELDRLLANALQDLDAEQAFLALVLAAGKLLADVPIEQRAAFMKEALDAVTSGDLN